MPNTEGSQANAKDKRDWTFFSRREADGQDESKKQPSQDKLDKQLLAGGANINGGHELINLSNRFVSEEERYEQAKNAILENNIQQLVGILQNWGYDPNYRDKDDNTLLEYARENGNEAIIGYLSNGVDIDRPNEAQSEIVSEESVSVWWGDDDGSRSESGDFEGRYGTPDENWYKPLHESLQERRDMLRECIGKHNELNEKYSEEAALESFQANYSSHKDMMESLAILSVKAVKIHEERQGKKVYIYDDEGNKVELDKLDPSKTYNMVEDARGADLNTPPHGREPYIAQAAEHAMKMMLYINDLEKKGSIREEKAQEIRQDIAKKLDGFIKNINDLADKTPELIPGKPGKPNKKFNKAANSMVRTLEASFYASFPKEERAEAVTAANRWYDYVAFHRPHFNRAVIQKFQDKDGQTRTVSFAEHIMGELTHDQKEKFVDILGYSEGDDLKFYPKWFANLSPEEKRVLQEHIPAILAGNKCFPTQLSKIPVLRMGYDTQVYEFSGSEWKGCGGFAHHGAPVSMDGKLNKGQRVEYSQQIIEQLKAYHPNALIHMQSTNHVGGVSGGFFFGSEQGKIVQPFLEAGKGSKVFASAAGTKGWVDLDADFTGVKEYVGKLQKTLRECQFSEPKSETITYIEKELAEISRLASMGPIRRTFTRGNIHGTVVARMASVTTAFDMMSEEEKSKFIDQLGKDGIHELLHTVFCKSGKDRTGTATIASCLAILDSIGIDVEDIEIVDGIRTENQNKYAVINPLLLNGINGGSGGCVGAKSAPFFGLVSDRYGNFWEQDYANNNRPLEASQVEKRLKELEKKNPKGKVSQVENSSKEIDEGKQSSVAKGKSSGISDKVKGSLGGRYHKDEIKQVSDMSQINWDEIQNISAAAKECMKAVFSNDSLDRRVVEEFKVKHPEERNRNKVYMEVLDNIPENMIKTEVKKGDNNSAIQLKNNQEIIIKRENGKLNITIPEQYTGIITDYYTNSHLLVRDGEIVDLTTGSLPHRFGEIAVKGKDGERKLDIPHSYLDIVSATTRDAASGRGMGG